MSEPTYPALPGAASSIPGGFPARQSTNDDSDRPINQGTNLPEVPLSFKTPILKKLEHSNKDPAAWIHAVKLSLGPYRLKELIGKLPRPAPDDPSYNKWTFWSISVAAWLWASIDDAIQTRLLGQDSPPEYADDLYREIMTTVLGSNQAENVALEYKKLMSMRREGTTSASQYVIAYQNQFNILCKHRINPPFFGSLITMIDQLREDIAKVAFIEEKLAVLTPGEITREQYDEFVKTLLSAAELREHDHYFENANAIIGMAHSARIKKRSPFAPPRRTEPTPTAATDASTVATADQTNRGGHQGRGNNHAGQRGRGRGGGGTQHGGEHADRGSSLPRMQPPKGKDIYQYAKECRDTKQQRVNDLCSFCGYGPHNARSCFYLQEVPECDWTLSSHVWSLSGAIRDGDSKPGRVAVSLRALPGRASTAIVANAIEFYDEFDEFGNNNSEFYSEFDVFDDSEHAEFNEQFYDQFYEESYDDQLNFNDADTEDPMDNPLDWILPEYEEDDFELTDANAANLANSANQSTGWLLDSGASKPITGNISDFIEYYDWKPNQLAYTYADVHGQLTRTAGRGKLRILAALPDGTVNKAIINGYFDPTIPKTSRLLPTEYIADHCGLYYNARTKKVECEDGSIFGYTDTSTGTPFLIGPSADPGKHFTDLHADFDPRDGDSGYGSYSEPEDDPPEASQPRTTSQLYRYHQAQQYQPMIHQAKHHQPKQAIRKHQNAQFVRQFNRKPPDPQFMVHQAQYGNGFIAYDPDDPGPRMDRTHFAKPVIY